MSGFMLAVAVWLVPAPAAMAETRTLKLYFLHTKERAEIPFKRNGRYVQSGLDQINRFLRDWRRNEPGKMDPRLLDLLWEVYRASGSRDYIHVISAYRSPATNSMLRSRSSGVAKNSQHTHGRAIDFFLPDVKLVTLRNLGLKLQAGGVGYYPRSGSPFVHLDVAGVRHWPRMSRSELASVFPDGRTMHVPSDGKPLPGYQQAKAAYEARQRSGGQIQVAAASAGERSGGGGLLSALFGRGGNSDSGAGSGAGESPGRAAPAARTARPAPQTQPQPATVLAALPPRSLPVPRAAPRPEIAVGGGPAAVSQDPNPAEKPADAARQVALDIPLPKRRPEIAAPEPAALETAASQEAIQDEAPSALASAFVRPTRRPEAPQSTDVIAAILKTKEDTLPERQVGGLPVRVASASREEVLEQAALSLAAASMRSDPPAMVVDDTAASMGTPVSASPRIAMLSDGGASAPTTALSTGVRTTGKGPKPGPSDARPAPKSRSLPIDRLTPEAVLSRDSVVRRTYRSGVPTFVASIAEAPKSVYTAGFQKEPDIANARRFTGKAVAFLAVARFDGP